AVAVRVGAADLVVDGLQPLANAAVLDPHHGRWAGAMEAGLSLKRRKENLLLPDDVPLQAEEKLLEVLLGLGEVDALQAAKFREIAIEPVVIGGEGIVDRRKRGGDHGASLLQGLGFFRNKRR